MQTSHRDKAKSDLDSPIKESRVQENPYPLYNPHDHHDACGVGFIAEESGNPSRRVVELSLLALKRLEHRGGKGFDQDTGDGAGLLVDIPWPFFEKRMEIAGIEAMADGESIALASIFSREVTRKELEDSLKSQANMLGCRFLGLMNVPIESQYLGSIAQENQPDILHAFFAIPKHEHYSAEQLTYLLRKK